MILSSKYDEIMDRVKVTDDMRARVIDNVLESGATGHGRKKRNSWGIYLTLAACIIVTIAVIRVVPGMVNRTNRGESSTEVESTQTSTMTAVDQAIPDIKEFSSADELQQELGFEIADVYGVPFDISDKEYFSYWGYMAEIDYMGKDEMVIYRKAKETNDISGDYNEYAVTDVMDIGGVEITLKGNGNLYSLAIWQNGEYSYSLYIDKGADKQEFSDMIKSIS